MPPLRTCVVIGGGTMGADIALTLARAGCPTHLVETFDHVRQALPARLAAGLAALGCPDRLDRIEVHASLDDVDWPQVDVAIEAVPEKLDLKRALFADLARRARPDAWLTSNSSSFPISAIAEGLPGPGRFFGLHYFMPAHLVPLVEVVCGAGSDPALAREVAGFMRSTGKVPVVVKKDLPGFLANRLQHALAREALRAHRSGRGDRRGRGRRGALRVRLPLPGRRAPAAERPRRARRARGRRGHHVPGPGHQQGTRRSSLTDRVAAGRLGMKAGAGFYDWTPETIAAERARYEAPAAGGAGTPRAGTAEGARLNGSGGPGESWVSSGAPPCRK